MTGPVEPIPVEHWRAILYLQLEQCWNDIRQNDAILWQIPASIGAIVGLILNALGRTIIEGPVAWLDIAAVATAIAVTFSLVVTEYKNRIFQVTRNIYRKAIYKALVEAARLPAGSLANPVLDVREYEAGDLPGSVEVATRHIDREVLEVAWKAGGVKWAGERAAKLPAYKTLFYISIGVLLGELGLLIWLCVRFFSQ